MKAFLLIPFLTTVKPRWTIPSNIYICSSLTNMVFQEIRQGGKNILYRVFQIRIVVFQFFLWLLGEAGSGGSRCFPIFWGEAPIVKLGRETTFHFWLVA
jgi:hypothetical protein